MKPIIAAAAAMLFATLAAPVEAEAFNGFDTRYQDTRHLGYGGQTFYFGRFGYGKRAFGFPRYLLPPSAIRRALRVQQFCYISRPRFRRGLYRVRARDAYGRRVRLAVDPYSGAIVRLRYRY